MASQTGAKQPLNSDAASVSEAVDFAEPTRSVGLPPELRSARLAFVTELDLPALCESDVAHFRKVLRLEAGAKLNVSDGEGSWRRVRLGSAGVALTIDGPIQRRQKQGPKLTVAFAPTKGGRPEWAVQKLTELGVDRIVAIRSQRSVVRWTKERAKKQLERWQKVVREASMQSRRLFLPTVEQMVDLGAFLAAEPAARLCEPGGRQLSSLDSILVVGPEGGFTATELAMAENVDLSMPTILRTETAAVVAATALHFIK